MKTLRTLLLGLAMIPFAWADNQIDIQRYEQAKLKLDYEGNAGNLLQQMAQRLNIGFISYEADLSQKVVLKNAQEQTIKQLNSEISRQLGQAQIRFEQLGERLFLVVSPANSTPLLSVAQKEAKEEKQFIGEVVFDTPATNQADPKTKSENAQKLNRIFSLATDKTLLQKSKNKLPAYQVTSKEQLGLQTVRNTQLGTFLIFGNQVNTADFKVIGQFEEVAQNDNVIAILHKDKKAPTQIEIKDPSGKVLQLKLR